ncbi:MAG TPA: type III pantothenate kinase [Gemmatimonadales bacterium]|nr:type III pantothenate kinase [Gemmatimonadales bacterium]
MILVLDVGNTECTAGLFDGTKLVTQWRLTTDVKRTTDELVLLLVGLMSSVQLDPSVVTGSAIGSVVPRLTGTLAAACERAFGARALVVDASSPLPVTLAVDEPLTVGADRLINTLAASRILKRDTIVVDLGTATTYDCITKDGVFLGGVIAPGVRSSAETLYTKTSKLPDTELVMPARVIGTRTEECIRAGVLLGSIEAVEGLVRRIKAEWPGTEEPLVVATGGLAEVIAPYCPSIERVDPWLTLEGLRLAYELLSGPNA